MTVSVSCRAAFGEHIMLVGSSKGLGKWRAAKGCKLSWSPGDVWRGQVELLQGQHDFKVSESV